MSIQDFCNSNATIEFINALRQFRGKSSRFSCIGRPKRQNILVFLSGCSMQLQMKNGDTVEIPENGIYYAPYGSEYVLEVLHPHGGFTVGVNFQLFDEQGEPFVFSDEVQVFRASSVMVRAFEELAHSDLLPKLQSRILLETVIAEIGREEPSLSIPDCIRASVTHMQEHYTEPLTVADFAALSHISEVYFRRIFKVAFRMSPAAYLTRLRLQKAAEYLEYGDMSVGEIAEAVGYSGASYLTKVFKEEYGVTPLRYRKEKTAPPT